LLTAAKAKLVAKHSELLNEHAVGENNAFWPTGSTRREGHEGSIFWLSSNWYWQTHPRLKLVTQSRRAKHRQPSGDNAETERTKQI
jgi:hypothetical protein